MDLPVYRREEIRHLINIKEFHATFRSSSRFLCVQNLSQRNNTFVVDIDDNTE